MLARAAAAAILDALLPWKIAVQLAWIEVAVVDGNVSGGGCARSRSGNRASGGIVR
jgi:hypothetical protein